MSKPKPTLVTTKIEFPVTAEKILAIFRALTGREPTPEERAEVERKLLETKATR